MTLGSKSPSYPVSSENPLSSSKEFWLDFGIPVEHPDNIRYLSDSLKTAPTRNYRGSIARKVDKVEDVHSGVISTKAAKKLLESPVTEGLQIQVGLIEENSYPDDVYDAMLEVVTDPEIDESLESVFNQGGILLESSSNSPNQGRYDFIPVGYRASYADPTVEEDLEEMV